MELSHVTTFLAMLICYLLLIMIDVIFVLLVGNIVIFRVTLLLFYLCSTLWDFWDYHSRDEDNSTAATPSR